MPSLNLCSSSGLFKIIPVLSVFALLASCAKPPSEIEAAQVSRVAYSGMTCRELLMERDAEITTLERVSGQQVRQRSWDIALNILILPGFGAIGGDSEEDVAQAKGKIIAIQEELEARCIKDDNGEIEEVKEEISHFFFFDPDSGVNRAVAQLRELYFGDTQ